MLTNLPAYSMRVFWSESDQVYIAVCPEFQGLSAFGPTYEDAVRELRSALSLAAEVLEEDGDSLPEANTAESYSGQFRLRLPKRLHAELAAAADDEGVSLNSLAIQILSEAVGARRVSVLVTRQLNTAMRELWSCVGSVRSAVADLRQRASGNTTQSPKIAAVASNRLAGGIWATSISGRG